MGADPVLLDDQNLPCTRPLLPFCPVCEDFIPCEKACLKNNGWSYYRCQKCGLIMLHPLPDEAVLRSFYNDEYKVDFKHYVKRVRRASRVALKDLGERFPNRGSLLEIGCSYGGFLAEARHEGWHVTGVELSSTAAAYAREHHQLRVFSGDLRAAFSQLERRYDAIVLFHVIEHLPEPTQFLLECRKLLQPKGLLVLKTPNASSLIAKVAGSFWQWVSPPAHLFLYCPKTIGSLLQKCGYEPAVFRSAQGDANNNFFAALSSVAKRVVFRDRHQALPALRRSLPVRVTEVICELGYLPCRMLLDPWLDRKLRQPELYVLAVNQAEQKMDTSAQ